MASKERKEHEKWERFSTESPSIFAIFVFLCGHNNFENTLGLRNRWAALPTPRGLSLIHI